MTLLLALVGCPWIGPGELAAKFDADGDGHDALAFGGDDCDDDDARVHPGAVEVWYDGVDQDCGGDADDDQDGDGVGRDRDCDDRDPTRGAPPSWYPDLDGDGYGDQSAPTASCDQPPGEIADGTDCDDARPDVNPAGDEVCGPADEDCDGLVDLDDPSLDPSTLVPLYGDADGDGWGVQPAIGSGCAGGDHTSVDPGDCDDADPRVFPTALELCDGYDDDCDGLKDDADPSLDPVSAGWYLDADHDGFGEQATVVASCAPVPGRIAVGGDCDDEDARTSPAEVERCGGADEDCDGAVDDADPDVVDPVGWYTDGDADGYGADPLVVTACLGPVGSAPNDLDCDDGDPLRNVGEVWYDGVDQDCSGDNDDDQDGDGHPVGGADCDDTDPRAYVGATEVWYDGVDEDCDGASDYDHDRDGHDSIPWGDDCDDLDPFALGGGLAEISVGSGTIAGAITTLGCDGGVILLRAGVYDVGVDAALHAQINRPVTIRGEPGTVLDYRGGTLGAMWDVRADLTVESLTLTGGPSLPAITSSSAVDLTLRDVVCASSPKGCVATSQAAVTVEDSAFQGNVGTPIQVSSAPSLVVSGTTFTGDQDSAIVTTDIASARVSDCAFSGEKGPLPGVVSFVGGSAVVERTSFEASDDGPVLHAYLVDDVALTDVSAVGNTVAQVVDFSGASGVVDIDGLTISGTLGAAGYPVVEVFGDVARVDRVTVVDSVASGLGAAVSVTSLGASPVEVHHLLVASHDGDGLALDGDADVRFATVVGADSGLVRVGGAWTIDSVALVGDVVGFDTNGGSVAIARTWGWANGADTDVGPIAGLTVADPQLVTWLAGLDPARWDLHPRWTSPLRDGGDPLATDPDGSLADAGAYGGRADLPWYDDDVDRDALPDGWERLHGLDPSVDDRSSDLDLDGVTAIREFLAGTWPELDDTDGDGVGDGADAAPLDPLTY